ncbi:MAG: hypothetical protein H8E76_00310 [Helicobacteraceae bacterium]|nr:hypothetical protein [Candidatus Sulfurimonas ponti]
MNEMYDMSIVTHYYGVLGILVVIFINSMMLKKAKNINDYKRQMSLYTPVAHIPIGVVIFTGVVMMAAKHLAFSVENILMIVFSIGIIYLEVKRAKALKYLDIREENALEKFKIDAASFLFMELVLTLSISIWMLI